MKILRLAYDCAARVLKGKAVQRTLVYCPGCETELISLPNNQHFTGDDGHEHYTCACGVHTEWDFDAPAPILISAFRI